MNATQKILIAAIVVFACTAGFTTYVVQRLKARSSSAPAGVNASPRLSAGAADPSSRVSATAATPAELTF
jgi:hypothetical protein